MVLALTYQSQTSVRHCPQIKISFSITNLHIKPGTMDQSTSQILGSQWTPSIGRIRTTDDQIFHLMDGGEQLDGWTDEPFISWTDSNRRPWLSVSDGRRWVADEEGPPTLSMKSNDGPLKIFKCGRRWMAGQMGKIRPWRPFQAETEEFSKTRTGPHQEGWKPEILGLETSCA